MSKRCSMKFVHISDLHIGKRLSEISLAEDQRHILNQIVGIVRDEKPDGVLIAGDVYDTTTPSAESVQMLDDFLTDLSDTGTQIFMISGNHDSPEKIGYGSALFRRNGIFINGRFDGPIEPIWLEDCGQQNAEVYLIPFVRPFNVRKRFPDAEINDYTDAVRTILENSPSRCADFKIAVAHQFVTTTYSDPETCDSEDPRIGDLDSMDASVFDTFDYVALGHLHIPQYIGRREVRYSGSPLKYSASEVSVPKSVTVVTFAAETEIREVPLTPLRDVRKVRGRLEDIIEAAKTESNTNDLIYAELTDEPVNAMQRIREVYPNTVNITLIRQESERSVPRVEDIKRMDPLEVFREMYRGSNGNDMSDEQNSIVRELMERAEVRF